MYIRTFLHVTHILEKYEYVKIRQHGQKKETTRVFLANLTFPNWWPGNNSSMKHKPIRSRSFNEKENVWKQKTVVKLTLAVLFMNIINLNIHIKFHLNQIKEYRWATWLPSFIHILRHLSLSRTLPYYVLNIYKWFIFNFENAKHWKRKY